MLMHMRLERRPRFALFALSLLLSAAACTPRPAADSFVEEKGAVVYGSDTRRNYYEASASEKSWLSSTAVVTDFVNLTPQMGFERMGFADVNLCTGQKFEGEWILKNAGTAFLAWDDHTMITAAHVDPCGVKINCDPATDPNECFRETIVFGYQRIQSATILNSFGEPTYTETSSDRRYRCKDVILEDRARDFIVFTLDRSVPASEATPLVIAATSPAVGAPVKVVGYGHALPGKVSDGKVVERLRNGAVRTTLDMVQGNSGSPIMNASGQVVGVASYGAYRSNTVIEGTLGGGACFLWNICPETGCPDAEPECVGTRKDGTKCGTLPPTRPYPEPFAVMISVEAISESIARQGAPHRGPRGFDFNGDGSEDVAIGYPRFAETDTNPIDNSTLNGMVGVLMGGGPLDAARLAELFPGVDLSWSLGIPLPGLKVYGDGLWNVSLTPGERFGQTIAWGNFDDDDADELLVGSVGTKIRVLNHDGKGDDVIDSSVIPGLAKYPSFVVGDFNGDTYDDLAVTVSGGTAIRYGRPKTGLRGVVGTIQVIPFGGSYAVGDFNCDGYEDLAVAVKGTPDPVKQNYSGGVRILLRLVWRTRHRRDPRPRSLRRRRSPRPAQQRGVVHGQDPHRRQLQRRLGLRQRVRRPGGQVELRTARLFERTGERLLRRSHRAQHRPHHLEALLHRHDPPRPHREQREHRPKHRLRVRRIHEHRRLQRRRLHRSLRGEPARR